MLTSWLKAGRIRPILWILVSIGLIASLVLAYERHRTEQSSKKVEFVFDYRDLLDIADYKANPQEFVTQQLEQMKKAKITSMAVYESTLNELRESRLIELYNARDAATLTQTPIAPDKNYTYVLFADPASQDMLRTMIESTFGSLGVATQPWSFKNQPGLIVQLPLDEASMKPLPPNPVAMKRLTDNGFHVVVRLSNRRPFKEAEMDAMLTTLEGYGVRSVIVDGDSVPGYNYMNTNAPTLKQMADLLNKHHMGLGAIELQKAPQKGFITLAKDTAYNVFRLHSVTENDTDKLSQVLNKKDLDGRIQALADQLVLAVKDRNIKMIFLNARPSKNTDKGTYADPLEGIYQSLIGKDGAVKRIEADGFTLGQAHAFVYHQAPAEKLFKLLVVLGSVSLIALTAAAFFPVLALPVLVLGFVGSVLLMAVSPEALYKILALLVAVCASSLAMIRSLDWLRRRMDARRAWSGGSAVAAGLGVLVSTTIFSMLGGAFVVGLLNHILYNLLLDQFKGVKVLAYLPILLVFLYLLLFFEPMTGEERLGKLKRLLFSKVSVLWIVTAGILLGAGYYYLSRTGNEGQASSVELLFRSFLENTLKVRPRTKELLIGHPLFLLGAYLCLKRSARYLWLVLVGAVAQADVVGTFTHLHTPLVISFIRVCYGLVFGALIGIALILVWEAAARSWNRWMPKASG